MRDVRDEILADALQPLELGDIVQNGERAAGGGSGQRPTQNFKGVLFGSGQGEPALHALAGAQYICHDFDERGIARKRPAESKGASPE